MRFTSSPGSTTSASRVTGSPMIEQLHCNIPTGMVIWINPSVAALRTGRPLLMKGSIPSEMKGFAAGAPPPPRTTSSHYAGLDPHSLRGGPKACSVHRLFQPHLFLLFLLLSLLTFNIK